ncbi:MAG TPA: polyprenol monophosphomannose synthase [Candidatus Dormibacteraeota bacterium]|nr:polyprenol monophosphomannose synthase [Candidatus Dormibacteraeota bacterium]
MSERVLVVFPTFNERENLERMVTEVRALGHDVLVVDDNSPDGTGPLADGLASADKGMDVLHRPAKLGLGSAYVAAFRLGLERGYDLLVEMDADGSHRVEHLPAIIDAARSGGGLGLGSRYVQDGSVVGWGLYRKLLSWGANLYCRTLLGLGIHDCTSGFRCYTREVLERIGLDRVISEGYSFQIEMVFLAIRAGFAVVEVPIVFEDRVAGVSKVTRGEIFTDLVSVARLRLWNGR